MTNVYTPDVVGVPESPVVPKVIPGGNEPLCTAYENGATPSRISNVTEALVLTTVHCEAAVTHVGSAMSATLETLVAQISVFITPPPVPPTKPNLNVSESSKACGSSNFAVSDTFDQLIDAEGVVK
jgi:hypothetical protein